MPRSIRWRLTVWNTLALSVLLAGFAGLVYALLARTLVGGVDRTLAGCLEQLDRHPAAVHDPNRLGYWAEEFWEHEHVACVVFGSDGQVLTRTAELAAGAVPPPPAPDGGRVYTSAVVPVMGRQRLLAAPLPHAADGRVVVLMAGLAETDHTLGHARTSLLTAVPVMLLASGALAYVLATRALAPMRELAEATRAVTAESLDRRLPVADPRDELGRLTATINDMIARLERSFAETRRFTADASHELRTPLAALRAETEVALGRPLSFADTQALLGSILEECDRLTRLTDQLLALARQDAGLLPPRREPVRVGELVRHVAETLQPFAEAKGVVLNAESGPADQTDVAGDPDLLRQVLFNLLDNALKYTPAGGTVDVTVDADKAEVTVRVRDTGEGIAAEHLPHLFDRFYRVDKARSREQGGTGLGLSIARGIVEVHGGRIAVESRAGHGTTFTVALPRSGLSSHP